MKPFYKLILLCLAAFTLQCCHKTPKPGFWKNKEIDADHQRDFQELNKQVLTDMKIDDEKHLGDYIAKELIGSRAAMHLVQQISTRLQYEDYTMLDEYYVVNMDPKAKRAFIMNKDTGDGSYILHYRPVAREMYFAFLVPKTGLSNFMITLIYAKMPYGWKLTNMGVGAYSVNNKTAPQLYKQAIEAAQQKHYSNAETFMELAHDCQYPSFVWKYKSDTSITNLYHKVIDKANKQFSLPLFMGKITVFDVSNKKTDKGTYPMISYRTATDLKNTAAIEKENLTLRKAIGKAIPGIDKDNDTLLFCAFNKLPNSHESVDRYQMAWKLK
jgi:hypothetical protein